VEPRDLNQRNLAGENLTEALHGIRAELDSNIEALRKTGKFYRSLEL
jgi:hypothetical protein